MSEKVETGRKFDFKHSQAKYKNPFSTPFKTSGSMTIETFGANAQNPLAMNELLYTRVWLNPTVTLFGLPFTTDIYYTTENNSLYNSNSFSLNFDAATFKRQLLEGVYKEINERKKVDRMMERDINLKERQEAELNGKLENLDNELEKLKKELADLETLRNTDYKPDIDLPDKDSLLPEIPNYRDSTDISPYQDSLNRRYERLKAQLDKLEKDKQSLTEKIETIRKKKEELNTLRQADSSFLSMKEDELHKKSNLKSITEAYNSKYKKLLGIASGFDRFNIGVAYPSHSEFTVMGTPIKGIDIGWSNDLIFTSVSLGKAAANDFRFFSTERPDFDRNFYALTIGLGNRDKSHLYYSRSYFNDPETIVGRQRVSNAVNALGVKGSFWKNKLTLSGEIAKSDFRGTNSAETDFVTFAPDTFGRIEPTYKLSNLNTAFRVEGVYLITENLEFQTKIQRVSPRFRTLGNPFMRTGFFERDFSLKGKFLKNRLATQVFYKANNDNLANENSATNRISGYGVMLQTNFSNKYPNLSVYHSPYQHGNNHPDSLLRSFNQFSVTNATLTYSRKIKQAFVVSSLSFSQSVMSLDNLGKTGMRSVALNTGATFTQGIQANFLWQANSTNPGVDTLNANLLSATVSKNINSKFTAGAESHITSFKNGAAKNGGKVMLMYRPSSKLSLSFSGGYDYLYKLWRISSKSVFTIRFKMIVKW